MYANPLTVGTPGGIEFARRRLIPGGLGELDPVDCLGRPPTPERIELLRQAKEEGVLPGTIRDRRRRHQWQQRQVGDEEEEEDEDEDEEEDEAEARTEMETWRRDPLREHELWHSAQDDPPERTGCYWVRWADPNSKRAGYWCQERRIWLSFVAGVDLDPPAEWASDTLDPDGQPFAYRYPEYLPQARIPRVRPPSLLARLTRLQATIPKSISSLRVYQRRGMPTDDVAKAKLWIALHVAARQGRQQPQQQPPRRRTGPSLSELARQLGTSRPRLTRLIQQQGCPRDLEGARQWLAALPPKPVNLAAFGRALGLPQAQVYSLVARGMPLDLKAARTWLATHRRQRHPGPSLAALATALGVPTTTLGRYIRLEGCPRGLEAARRWIEARKGKR